MDCGLYFMSSGVQPGWDGMEMDLLSPEPAFVNV